MSTPVSLQSSIEAALRKAIEDHKTSTTTPTSAEDFVETVRLAVATVLVDTFQSAAPVNIAVSPRATPKKPVRGYIDGCFDIMHSGHYNAVRQAKALCDILVVGVHTDEEIMKHKGPPVMNDRERRAMVDACKWADEIAWGTPYDPSIELLDKLNCDFCVHGDDMSTTANGHDAYGEVKAQNRLRTIKRTEGVSTTDLVGRLLLMTKQHHIPSSPSLGPSAPVTTASPSLGPRNPASPSAGVVLKELPTLSLGSPAAKVEEAKHYAAGISNFLPTTWRISQFANNRVPKRDDTVVYIDGAFDLFHVGHVETLEKAKKLGTFLYVGIHDDMTINRHKGKNYPIMNLHERVMNVLSCRCVDEVVIGAPWVITRDLITSLNIKVVASGSNTKMDPAAEDHTDPYGVAKTMGIYQEVPTSSSLTTDDVVQRIIDNRRKYEARTANRGAKDLKYLENKTYIEEGGNRDTSAPVAAAATPVTNGVHKTTAQGTTPAAAAVAVAATVPAGAAK